MAIFQPSYVVPDVRSGIGLGVIDATQPMKVSWRINGQSALVAFSITIFTNTSSSTQLYSTGKISNGCPAYGTASNGEIQLFSYTIPSSALSSAGITNGNEYKIIIQQWWSENDSVTQSSASVFTTRATPTLSIAAIGTESVISTRYYTFTGNYAQAQGDVLNWFRWQIAYANDTENPFYDTGNVSGTMNLSFYYDGFFTGNSYAIRLSCQTESGVVADTGWVNFSVDYQVNPPTGEITVSCVAGTDAVLADWSGMSAGLDPSIEGFALYRQRSGASELVKVAETDNTVFRVYDYSATSQQGPYTYYLFPLSSTTYASQPIASDPISPCWWNWTLMECVKSGSGKIFTVKSAFRFQMDIASGSMSNNNTPSIENNFTQYPKIQLAPQNYKSGTLSALLGVIDWSGSQPRYVDTIAWRDALFALSVSNNPLFLKSRKGDLLRIQLAAPVTSDTNDATAEQTQQIGIQWVEVGSADGVGLYSLANENIQQGGEST